MLKITEIQFIQIFYLCLNNSKVLTNNKIRNLYWMMIRWQTRFWLSTSNSILQDHTTNITKVQKLMFNLIKQCIKKICLK
jgi:hypothetical protein